MATRIVIELDRSRCDGFGSCVNAAPDIFDLDDEGRVRLRRRRASPWLISRQCGAQPTIAR
jgi:ferredoxin